MRKIIISNSITILKVKIPMKLSDILKEAKESGGKEIAISTTILYLVLLLFPGGALGKAVSVALQLPHL